MPIPDYQSLMLPVLKSAAQSDVKLSDVVQVIIRVIGLSEQEAIERIPSGKQTLIANRVGWAKTYLTKAGLLESTSRGYFRITDRGREVLRSNSSRINNAFLMQFDGFQQFVNREINDSAGTEAQVELVLQESQTPDEIMRAAHRQMTTTLAQELLDRILLAPPDFFERLIVDLLISMGYGGSAEETGRVLGGSGDNGVDGVIYEDPLGLDRLYVQAKRYAPGNIVGSEAIREFCGSLDHHRVNKGVFVTTSGFSEPARNTASSLTKRIVLIDGAQLTSLMIRHNMGCRVQETLYLKKIDEDFFE
ncbi:MAG: Mrr restriction system protein (plasmid) [Chroococcopsis gigantea SAG 12.99]|jgi:restriction system protein|nr:Mrr restriction system protein [Chroococcopsis gigantea SAG 12.99]